MISIVIVNWNSGPLLEKCVNSLRRYAPQYPTVIIDNASTDDSLEFADAIPGVLSIIRNQSNLGFAAACNIGWRATTAEYVLFLNPDTECLPGSIEILNQTMASGENVWAAGGHLVDRSGIHQADFNVRSFPNIPRLAAEMLLLDGIARAVFVRRGNRHGVDAAVEVDQPAAACLMVTREALERIGGFDERFHPAWFEDVDLCRRIRSLGGRILYQPAAVFRHQGGYSLRRMARITFLEHFHTNQIRYFRKHFGNRAAARVKRWIVMGLLLRGALSLIHSPFPGVARETASQTFRGAARRIRNLRETEI